MTCRGQAYDNASVTSGIHSGAQRRIKEINSKAIYVLCMNDSLNLADVHAVGSSEFSDIFSLLFHEMRYYSFVKLLLHIALYKKLVNRLILRRMQHLDAQFVKSLLSDMSLFVNATATCILFHSISVACYCVLCVRGVGFLITPCPLSAFNRKRLRGVSDVGA